MKRFKINQKFQSLLFVLLVFGYSCQTNEEPLPTKTFQEVAQVGGSFEPAVSSFSVEKEETNKEVINGEVWKCTTKTIDALKPGGGDNGFPLFNPNASVVYPGSLLQGKSLRKATPDVIAVERSGGTISYDLNNGNLSSSFTVDKVAKSSIQNAMNNIIASSPPDLPANFVFRYSQVQSEQALAYEMGIDYETAFTSVSSDFSFSSSSNLNRILVELNQSFYTMSFDIPTSMDGLFAEGVTPDDLARYVQEGNPATYISDVTYGRIYYMLIESSSSYTEMEAEIQGSFNGVVSSVDVDISANSLSKLSNLKIKVMAFGGDAAKSLLTVGETDLNKLVELLAESTTISTGLPISYVVRSVLTNQIVGTQLATKYDETHCEVAAAGGEPAFTVHWDGQVLSKMGPIGAAYAVSESEFILIDIDGKQFLRSDIGTLEGPFPIADLGDGDMPFERIGAACNIFGNQIRADERTILFIDDSGTKYSYLSPDNNWGSWYPISDMAGGTNPFNLNGIGAILFHDHTPTAQSDVAASRHMVNRDGLKYTRYDNSPAIFNTVINIENWGNGGGDPDNIKMPFEVNKVGAGIGFDIGNKHYNLFFNLGGTKYAIQDYNNEWIGPFDL